RTVQMGEGAGDDGTSGHRLSMVVEAAEAIDELRLALRGAKPRHVDQALAEDADAEAPPGLDRLRARRLRVERNEQKRRLDGNRAAGADRQTPGLAVQPARDHHDSGRE